MNKIEITKHFDSIADRYDSYLRKNKYYHEELNNFIISIVRKNCNVLEIGSATGELIGHIKAKNAVGIDISTKMVEISQKKYSHIKFLCTDLKKLTIDVKFDYILISNLLDYLPDIMEELTYLKKFVHQDTMLIITTVNPVWEAIMRFASFIGLRMPDGQRNFVTNNDIVNLLYILDYEVVESGYRIFIPKPVPFFSYLINKIFPRIPGIRNFCTTQFIIGRLKPDTYYRNRLSCSVIIPCYNESDNIRECIERVPKMGTFTEILVVDDGSTDSSVVKVKELKSTYPNVSLISYSPNKGKGFAVKSGFDNARGDVLIVLDADMTVEPEELPRFFHLIEDGKAEFVNGTRMIYPREKESMKILNFIGNKIFGIILSLIMGQRNTDTLCGTKALRKKDYLFMKMGACKWGDFDLLFEASKLKLKMLEMPVHYKKRLAGRSKMMPLRHGWQLLKICWKGIIEVP